MKQTLFDIVRFLVRVSPKGKSTLINLGLRILGTRYGGAITAQGSRFWIEHIHALNRSLFFLGIYEPAVTAAIKDIVKPGMTVFDIGSNFGWYTILMARLVGPSGRVYAFDIEQSIIDTLHKSIALNRLVNVTVIRSALGDRNGEAEFFNDQASGTANLSEQLVVSKIRSSVSMIRFDDFVNSNRIEKIDFIKCDIDGAEALFLEGARESMRRTPVMIMEIFDQAQRVFHSSAVALLQGLRALGYQVRNIDAQSEELTESDTTRYSSINVLCIRK